MHDGELLGVLAAEHGDIGLHRGEQLGDDRRNTTEVARSMRTLERPGEVPRLDRGVEPLGVHRGGRRGVHRVDTHGGAPLDICLEGARIAGEILGAVELQRVDEDRHHHCVGMLVGHANQLEMALVERPHRRDEGHRRPGEAALPGPRPGRVGVGEHLW